MRSENISEPIPLFKQSSSSIVSTLGKIWLVMDGVTIIAVWFSRTGVEGVHAFGVEVDVEGQVNDSGNDVELDGLGNDAVVVGNGVDETCSKFVISTRRATIYNTFNVY